MHAFDILGDPVRRRILELLADGEVSAGEIVTAIGTEFGISQPAVSRQLRVLREAGFATVRPEGTRRWYTVRPEGFDEVERWLARNRHHWQHALDALDALETEIARGKSRKSPTKE